MAVDTDGDDYLTSNKGDCETDPVNANLFFIIPDLNYGLVTSLLDRKNQSVGKGLIVPN